MCQMVFLRFVTILGTRSPEMMIFDGHFYVIFDGFCGRLGVFSGTRNLSYRSELWDTGLRGVLEKSDKKVIVKSKNSNSLISH